MTPLSDTHARAWKIEGVIDKLARAIKKKRASRSHDKLGFWASPWAPFLLFLALLFLSSILGRFLEKFDAQMTSF